MRFFFSIERMWALRNSSGHTLVTLECLPGFTNGDLNASKEKSKPSLKIGSVSKAFLFWYWQRLKNFFFLGIYFFCFSRERAETFSICLKKNFMKPHKISTQSDNRLKKWKLTIVWISWMSWNFVRFHEIQFQKDAERFSFLSWKTKQFYS